MKYDAAIVNISNFIMASLTAYLSTESSSVQRKFRRYETDVSLFIPIFNSKKHLRGLYFLVVLRPEMLEMKRQTSRNH